MGFVGRFEHFADNLQFVLTCIGIEGAGIVHLNRSEHQHYTEYYTERTKKIIARKYA